MVGGVVASAAAGAGRHRCRNAKRAPTAFIISPDRGPGAAADLPSLLVSHRGAPVAPGQRAMPSGPRSRALSARPRPAE